MLGGRGTAGLSCGSRARHPRYERPGRRVVVPLGLVPISDPLAPIGSRWQHPPDHQRLGARAMPARQASHPDPASDRGYEEGNGGRNSALPPGLYSDLEVLGTLSTLELPRNRLDSASRSLTVTIGIHSVGHRRKRVLGVQQHRDLVD